MKNTSKKGPKKLAAKPRASFAPESLAKLKETIDAQARELREALQRETATGEILLHNHSDYDYRKYSPALWRQRRLNSSELKGWVILVR